MADLATVAADVLPVYPGTGGAGSPQMGIAGANLVGGDAVYLDSTLASPTWKKADANVNLADTVTGVGPDVRTGIVVNAASSSGQPVAVMESGEVDLGVTLTVAEEYVVSENAGKIKAFGDLASGEYYHRLGYATAADNLVIDVLVTGQQKP